MATLTASRNTLQMGSDGTFKMSIPLKANAKVFKGGMVAIDNTTGYGVVPTVATTLISAGVALADADNTGGASGALSVDVILEAGFLMDCSGQAQTALGRLVYFVDDHTVTVTSTGASIAGVCIGFVSATQLWVFIGVPRTAGT
jgi:hypothetical protein